MMIAKGYLMYLWNYQSKANWAGCDLLLLSTFSHSDICSHCRKLTFTINRGFFLSFIQPNYSYIKLLALFVVYVSQLKQNKYLSLFPKSKKKHCRPSALPSNLTSHLWPPQILPSTQLRQKSCMTTPASSTALQTAENSVDPPQAFKGF